MPRKSSATKESVDSDSVVAWLERAGTKKVRDGMARYGIPSTRAFGVTVGALRAYAKTIGRDHALAQALWKTGHYEARMLVSFIADPAALTAKQMDVWASDFDNWAICDTMCFHLFDRTPLAWPRVHAWATARAEFKKRAVFALVWGLSVHDKTAEEARFLECFPLIERASEDDRDYVRKAVDMALRALGKKRNPKLKAAALELAQRLGESDVRSQVMIGRSALRELGRVRR